MAISILHVGLPLDHPLIPANEREKITQRLANLQQRMSVAGYIYNIFAIDPEEGLCAFRKHLGTNPCDGVLIGGGVAGNEAMSYFMEQIINTAHDVLPTVRIMIYSHSVDVRTTVERWFPAPDDPV